MKSEFRMRNGEGRRRRNGAGGETFSGQRSTFNVQRGKERMRLMAPSSGAVVGGGKIGWLIFDLTKGSAYIPLSVL